MVVTYLSFSNVTVSDGISSKDSKENPRLEKKDPKAIKIVAKRIPPISSLSFLPQGLGGSFGFIGFVELSFSRRRRDGVILRGSSCSSSAAFLGVKGKRMNPVYHIIGAAYPIPQC